MKKVILISIIILGLSSSDGHGQASDSSNIYLISLTQHIEYLRSLKTTAGLSSVYVETDELTTENLPEKIGDMTISYLTRQEIKSKTLDGKRIRLIVVRPVVVNEGSLRVNVIDFFVTSKKNNFNYVNLGGSIFIFKHNCEKGRIELSHQKHGEI